MPKDSAIELARLTDLDRRSGNSTRCAITKEMSCLSIPLEYNVRLANGISIVSDKEYDMDEMNRDYLESMQGFKTHRTRKTE